MTKAVDRNYEAWNTIEDLIELHDEIEIMIKRLNRRKINPKVLEIVRTAKSGLVQACAEIDRKHGRDDTDWNETRKRYRKRVK